MNVLSLFDGMSCGQIALNKLGIKVDNYFASEIDKYAMQITQKNYPNTKQLGSVVYLKGSDFCRGNIIKYVIRAGKKKDELQDLLKAQDYLNREIELIRKNK